MNVIFLFVLIVFSQVTAKDFLLALENGGGKKHVLARGVELKSPKTEQTVGNKTSRVYGSASDYADVSSENFRRPTARKRGKTIFHRTKRIRSRPRSRARLPEPYIEMDSVGRLWDCHFKNSRR